MLRYFNPLAWMRWFGEFVYLWAVSAPWSDAPKAIPFIVLMAFLTVAGAISLSGASQWRNGLLDSQLADAWERDDFVTAELVIRRQLSTRPDDMRLIYRLAIARDAQEQHDEALELMRQLVTVKKHAPSAEWLLRDQYIGKSWVELDDAQKLEFGQLLKLVNEAKPDEIGVKQLYADYLIASERLTEAVPLLEDLARYQPMRGLQAAAICRRLGNFSQADLLAEKTLEKVADMLSEDPTNADLAQAVAQNQVFLSRYEDAVRVLDGAIKLAKSNENKIRLNQSMGEAIVAWVDYIEKASQKTTKDRLRVLKMLETALRYAPQNPRVLTLVADKVLDTIGNEDEEVDAIRQSLIEGTSPGIAHFLQGTTALMNDDLGKATLHLKIAAELMPRSAAILNNLAVALAMRPDADLEQALKISNLAIEQTPSPTPHFFETRGQILFRLKEYLKAIPDLERALIVPSLARNAHESLAVCYDEMGEPDLAEAHRTAAKQDTETVDQTP
ncbi:MAG: tetratricopeptide repeat protein [Pirellulaceae bacterium]